MADNFFVILDYGLGNVGSVKNAVSKLGIEVRVTSATDDIKKCSAIIIPGVGSFDEGVNQLKARGIFELIKIVALEKPILGICLGMQLLFESSEESILGLKGLSLIPGKVVAFNAVKFAVPHVGWNSVKLENSEEHDFYFVHSYFCIPTKNENILGTTKVFDEHFCSMARVNNVFGVQFHPEKSGPAGLNVLQKFIEFVKETNNTNIN